MSTQQLNITFKYTPYPVVMIDGNGSILDANIRFIDVFGYHPDALLKMDFADLLPAETIKEFQHFKSKRKHIGITRNILTDLRTIRGDYVKVRLDSLPEYASDGDIKFNIIILEPVEDGLPNYDQIFNSSSVPLIIYDVDTAEIVDVNAASCSFYGYEYSEMVGMHLGDLNIEGREKVLEQLKTVMKDVKGKNFIVKHRLKNGDIRYVEVWPSPLVHKDKNYICSVLTDITERYRKELNLHAVAELSTKLLITDTEISDVSEMVVDSIKALTGSSEGFAGSIDEDTKNLMIHAFSIGQPGLHNNTEGLMFFCGSDGKYRGLWGHSLNIGEPFYTNDVANCDVTAGAPEWHIRLTNFISCPVIIDNKIIGLIAAANSPLGYDDKDIEAMHQIAKLYAIAIRYQKEKQLETLFSRVFENATNGIVVFKPHGQGDFIFKNVNKSYADSFSCTVEDLIGQKLTEKLPAIEEIGCLENMNRVFETGEPIYEPRVNYTDENNDLIFESYLFRLQEKYVVAIQRDITELAKSADALAKSEEKYRSYINNSPDPIIIIDEDANIVEVNEASCEKFEYTVEEFADMKVFDLWPDYLREEYGAVLQDNLSKEGFNIMHPHISKSGQIYHMRVHVKVMHDGFMMGVLQDNTQRVRMQYELNELNEDLQRRVKEEVALREKQEKTLFEQKKLADMGQMMNAISHQWRQPLNGLGLFIQHVTDKYLNDKLTRNDMEEFEEVTGNIIQHMSQTIEDFRSFYKPDSQPVAFEVVKELCSILVLIESQLTMHNIKASLNCKCSHSERLMSVGKYDDCKHDHTRVVGYPGEFKQVLLNIIYNAVDSIDDALQKGLSEQGKLDIEVLADGEKVKVTCCDNGVGIDEAVLPNVFDPYFTTKEEGKGTGIGLYMATLVIDKHMNGHISAYNKDSNGACFEIVLPISKG